MTTCPGLVGRDELSVGRRSTWTLRHLGAFLDLSAFVTIPCKLGFGCIIQISLWWNQAGCYCWIDKLGMAARWIYAHGTFIWSGFISINRYRVKTVIRQVWYLKTTKMGKHSLGKTCSMGVSEWYLWNTNWNWSRACSTVTMPSCRPPCPRNLIIGERRSQSKSFTIVLHQIRSKLHLAMFLHHII